MKKIIAIAFAAIIAGFAISCQKEEAVSDKADAVQYTFNIVVSDQAGFDNDASTKGSESPKSYWENGDRIFLFFKPTTDNNLLNTYATLTYDGSEWGVNAPGLSGLGEDGTLSAVYVYNLDGSVTPAYSDNKWTIATGNTFYNCEIEVTYSVSDNVISASLNLKAPTNFVRFYVEGATGALTCDNVKGWKDIAIGSEMTFSNVTCTGYMDGFTNSDDSNVKEYYGRIVDGTSLNGKACEFSVVKNGKVYERTATPSSDAKSFTMNTSATDDKKWTEAPGKLPGLFTVGKGADGTAGTADDVQVRFSQGNLVAAIDANGAPTAWKFATNQYDYIGGTVANTSIGNTSTSGTAGDVDLFGWSTDATSNNWGIHTKTEATQDYTTGSFKDWGKAYCTSKSISPDNTWRTLSKDEWTYLFNTRSNASNLYKYGVTVCGKTNCVVLLPDDWAWDTNTVGADWQTGGYPMTQTGTEVTWEKMEKAGAVCLPAAGSRLGSNIHDAVGFSGFYWSSTAYNEYYVWLVTFSINTVFHDGGDYYRGCSVRLISDIK